MRQISEPESPPKASKAIPAPLTAIEGRKAPFDLMLTAPDSAEADVPAQPELEPEPAG